jgi:F-type H+-transporting ATPase subunit delta
MAGDATTIARPYAEAVFECAKERGDLDRWSDMLKLLADVVTDPTMVGVIGDPLFGREDLADLIQQIGGDGLNSEGGNLVKLLVQNDRLPVLPEMVELYEQLKADHQRVLNAHLSTAYPLEPAEQKKIAAALTAKLGREVTVTSETDSTLIGGVLIRAGDMVIDGSVRGHLQQLANELEI